ncbi:AbrB/MazE/SpoVT family DNA-binding domain-containing protein [Variovorax paradoxus]|nr:AbrB/MazE/SpoVT family DNA-binding domain-containing protein [Variovorax paradoxus]
MAIATLTSKGRITLPAKVRAALGLRVGAKVEFVADGDGFKMVPFKIGTRPLKGRFAGRTAAPVCINAMNNAVGDAAVARPRGSGR